MKQMTRYINKISGVVSLAAVMAVILALYGVALVTHTIAGVTII
ncbi:MAG: hypothetical protein ACR2OT_02055 [Parvibaculales bacterium]